MKREKEEKGRGRGRRRAGRERKAKAKGETLAVSAKKEPVSKSPVSLSYLDEIRGVKTYMFNH